MPPATERYMYMGIFVIITWVNSCNTQEFLGLLEDISLIYLRVARGIPELCSGLPKYSYAERSKYAYLRVARVLHEFTQVIMPKVPR